MIWDFTRTSSFSKHAWKLSGEYITEENELPLR